MHRGRLRLVVNLGVAEAAIPVDGAAECVYSPVDAAVSEAAVVLPAESFAVVRAAP